ncbi:Pretoxin HINT domain-containing protein [Singulisphaera sp. GP187]|uniref:polymorphic toxin-type HINT domain-containing protein n=1 Tax=Singulisphaera sp. GP187 TaxID=1882752 RepID=UPI00092A8BC5|nr:polymorphic toxin-type HINT domain-containing protein [Singulisphaera sp. GP187]SIO58322.1 Pretoxin HINT domain-containing protein [Singulisphaera sp. GP187]
MLGTLLVGTILMAASPESRSSSLAEYLKSYETASATVGRDPNAHVKLALWCEEHGLQAERLKHLAIAVVTEPKHSVARGLMGLVSYGGQWQRPETIRDKVRADATLTATLAEYNAKRETMHRTADGHWDLALWCEKHGLKAEATAHLTAVTRLDPARDAAWKRLGCKKQDGRWMTEEQIATLKRNVEEQKKADRHWRPLLEKWRERLPESRTREIAERRLTEVTDPRAVPMIWALFASGDAARQLVAVQMLGQIDAGTASRALATLSVFGKSAEVRRVATETLKRRDPRDFVTLLVELLRDPIKYEVRPVNGPGSQGVLFIEGKQFNVRRVYTTQPIPFERIPPRLFDSSIPFEPFTPQNLWLANGAPGAPTGTVSAASVKGIVNNPSAAVGILAGQFGRNGVNGTASPVLAATGAAVRRDAQIANVVNASQRDADVAQAKLINDVNEIVAVNTTTHARNMLALPVLESVTGQELGENQDAWKTWWSDQQGYQYKSTELDSESKPTFTQMVETPNTQPRHSCFGAGTLVHTLDGLRKIESIQVGDRVLSQNTRTGTLSFDPVLAVFHNPPAATLRIELESEGESTIATGIHRFWKAGKGWTMARDLTPGDTIRTLNGVAKIVSIKDEAVQPVFNLEVADGQSFFVGPRGTLVHDNSLVEPTPEPFDAAPVLGTVSSAKP